MGVSVAITSNGNTFYYQQGFRDREQSFPIDTQTQFQLASISKVFTAVGVFRLVESGKVMLDSPANQYLARWKIESNEFDASQVTVRHLLDHTSGLSVDGHLGFMPNATRPTLEDSLNGELGSHSIWTQLYNQLIPSRQQVTLIQQPGSDWLYSGGGYTVLQLLIEDVSGKLFSTYMQEQVLSPLGLQHSTFQFENVDQQRLALGYSGFLSLSPNPNYRYTALAAAGLYSTIEDLIRFASVFDASKETLLNLVVAAIILWNTEYISQALETLRSRGEIIDDALLSHLSPLGWEHINLTGDYIWPELKN
ncbi:serine hydrolase [Vibrio sp. OCN044]|uniref:Serine hydrolase n=1 Tax=Vibrio tetraodonis subsp. pristinus TaxID=2695891 RepID=A0A6L8M050_9VIBR|nr:serine hydrolase [Vibrio tetraodonis subsp. pristinus]